MDIHHLYSSAYLRQYLHCMHSVYGSVFQELTRQYMAILLDKKLDCETEIDSQIWAAIKSFKET